MLSTLLSSLIMAQAAAVAPVTLEEDRLRACMDEARSDPGQAITTASEWLEGTGGVSRSMPQQCLGFAYMGVLRWGAAKDAFLLARDARLPDDKRNRARLGAMAGNAAMTAGSPDQALLILQIAQDDAASVSDGPLAGSIAADRARALVALDREEDAALALEQARQFASQDPAIWLLSATLARRMEDLENAQGWIETAARLDPANPAIGLEAGLIAAIGGFDDAARSSWQSVIDTAGLSPQADQARTYIQQLEEAGPAR